MYWRIGEQYFALHICHTEEMRQVLDRGGAWGGGQNARATWRTAARHTRPPALRTGACTYCRNVYRVGCASCLSCSLPVPSSSLLSYHSSFTITLPTRPATRQQSLSPHRRRAHTLLVLYITYPIVFAHSPSSRTAIISISHHPLSPSLARLQCQRRSSP